MSHKPEPISFWSAVDTLPAEPKSLEPARTRSQMGGDTNCSVWKRLEAATVTELNDAKDEAIHLMEEAPRPTRGYAL